MKIWSQRGKLAWEIQTDRIELESYRLKEESKYAKMKPPRILLKVRGNIDIQNIE